MASRDGEEMPIAKQGSRPNTSRVESVERARSASVQPVPAGSLLTSNPNLRLISIPPFIIYLITEREVLIRASRIAQKLLIYNLVEYT